MRFLFEILFWTFVGVAVLALLLMAIAATTGWTP